MIAVIGYILSPLSWWNDLFINIPLAYVFAIPFGFIHEDLFVPLLIIGYWITNIAGFFMLHKGVLGVVHKDGKLYNKSMLIGDILLSVIYTIIVLILVWMDWLVFPSGVFE